MSSPNSNSLLLLLQSALNESPVDECFIAAMSPEEWQKTWTDATRHGVIGIVADRILSLESRHLPDEKIVIQCLNAIKYCKSSYFKHRQTLESLAQSYTMRGWLFVLLKGLSNAQNYPHPSLHAPGDIDIFFIHPEHYNLANSWAKQNGCKMGETSLYEQPFYYDGILIEHHKHIGFFGKQKYDRRLNREVKRVVSEGLLCKMALDNTEVEILPPTFVAFYLLQHIVHHFSFIGVGLKPLCDWCMHLKRYKGTIDIQEFERLIDLFDLSHPYHVFAGLCVRYLHISEDIFPIAIDHFPEQEEIAIQDILRGGRFGFSNFEGQNYPTKWHLRWHMLTTSFERAQRLHAVAPQHIKTRPWVAILNRIRLLFINS